MLIGQHQHTIDSKKRLALPVKFRGELGNKVIITKGVEKCLVVYTEKEWGIMSQKLSSLPISQGEARSFTRHLLASATEISLDKLGRILIPDFLKDRETGLFCQPKNPKDIADKIMEIVKNQDLRQKLVKNGRKLVEEKYDWDIIAKKFENVYLSM